MRGGGLGILEPQEPLACLSLLHPPGENWLHQAFTHHLVVPGCPLGEWNRSPPPRARGIWEGKVEAGAKIPPGSPAWWGDRGNFKTPPPPLLFFLKSSFWRTAKLCRKYGNLPVYLLPPRVPSLPSVNIFAARGVHLLQ